MTHQAQAQNGAPASDHFVLRGEVVAAGEGPLAGAVVRLFGSDRMTTTGSQGEFTLSGLPHGTGVFEIVALGFHARLLTTALSDTSPPVTVMLVRIPAVLDSVKVSSTTPGTFTLPNARVRRPTDRITEQELLFPHVANGSALDAFALLRPGLFTGRPSGGLSSTTHASTHAGLFPRDPVNSNSGEDYCVGNRACDVDGLLSVSINEGPLGSPDILAMLPTRIIREMRYLPPIDATARFGVMAANGPVLLVYIK